MSRPSRINSPTSILGPSRDPPSAEARRCTMRRLLGVAELGGSCRDAFPAAGAASGSGTTISPEDSDVTRCQTGTLAETTAEIGAAPTSSGCPQDIQKRSYPWLARPQCVQTAIALPSIIKIAGIEYRRQRIGAGSS